MRKAISALLAGLAMVVPMDQAPAQDPAGRPHRVVSLNLCTDQLVLGLADTAQIAAVSFLAQDGALSPLAEKARALPVNRGRLEEVVALQPDLVVAGRFGAQQTVARLRQLGVKVLELDIAQDFETVAGQIESLAVILGQAGRGQAMAGELRARIRLLHANRPARPPVAIILDANGLTLGADTLADAVLQLAGYENAARRLGLRGLARIGLEQAIASDGEVLILNDTDVAWPSLGQALLDHPALARRFAGITRVAVPRKLWLCGGPAALEAAELLARARQGMRR